MFCQPHTKSPCQLRNNMCISKQELFVLFTIFVLVIILVRLLVLVHENITVARCSVVRGRELSPLEWL